MEVLALTSPLPPEVWERIFSFLQPEDLCSICLVCKVMFLIVSNPVLWKHMRVNTTMFLDRPSHFCQLPRFSHSLVDLRYSFRQPTKWNELFRILQYANACIHNLNLGSNDLSEVDSALLADNVAAIENVDLSNTNLTTEQLERILSRAATSTSLRRISLSDNDLMDVDPVLLGNAVVNMKVVNLDSTLLTPAQLETLLINGTHSSALLELDLGYNDLSKVNANLLGRAVANIPKVDLIGTELSSAQIQMILSLAICSGRLKELVLNYNDLSDIDHTLLAMAAENNTSIELDMTQLNIAQLRAIQGRPVNM